MTDMKCGYPHRDEALIDYVYEEGSDDAFRAHVAGCAVCTSEIAAMHSVRAQLETWQPPAASQILKSSNPQIPKSWWNEVPAWARVAAAVLCIGAGAGMANIHAQLDAEGWTISTGWIAAAPAPSTQPAAPGTDAAPWRADLTALESRMRDEMHAASAAPQPVSAANGAGAAAMSDAEIMRRVRSLVDDSERRQERELALRVGQVIRDVNAQRQTDLRKIDSNLGVIQTSTGAEIARQRQMLMNSMNYIVRVSEKN
jgi:hypothetical protein